MWIKNCFLYQITDRAWITELAQASVPEEAVFSACLPTQPVSLGLVSPVPGEETLDYVSGDVMAWRVRRQERLLPASVLNELTSERAAELQAREDRRVSRNERKDIKENLRLELLPRAFTRNQSHAVFLHRPTGWLMVEAGSAARADEITGMLRDVLGALPIVPLGSLTRPEPVWTRWLTGQAFPEEMALLDELVLVHPDEEATVRLKRVPPDSTEVGQLIEAGYRPQQVQIAWGDSFTARIDDKSVLKGLTFSDDLQEQAGAEGEDSPAVEWSAAAHLQVGALARFADWHLETAAVRDGTDVSQPDG